ncbi:hypothetical protein GH714_008852 [Hevea brasiliensis]|uniref:Receptor-like serine/threonine-protein kinase n=1 Tax=Hevea brasiliensis TaxID=3981 RepID=A0A6A6KBY1_HEVBR|nr:hypothetical protein GH714_008852 [Hevea brasiliensis]
MVIQHIREVQNPVAHLLDSGNLVVREANNTNDDNYLWQSFDYLSDTFLPGVKFGMNLVTGHDRYLVSWKSTSDPSLGDSTTRLDPGGYPQIYIRKDEGIVFRSGPWNGLRFSGMPSLKPNSIYTFEFVYNQEEIYYRYVVIGNSVISMMVLNNEGTFQRVTWSNSTKTWNLYLTAQMDTCDRYAVCGPYGSCNINNSPACACLNGFVPKNEQAWDSGAWSDGCVRKNESICGQEKVFRRYQALVPSTAFTIRYIDDTDTESSHSSGGQTRVWIIAVCVLVAVAALLVFCLLLHIRRKKFQRRGSISLVQERDYTDERRERDFELPLFDLSTIANATDNFSEYNKLGEGGFGPVYKGTLKDGQEIAVKRLSKDSTQGLDEFKNEVIFIAKLQHRNLVKLLGCCIELEEKMLIYEYMSNKSLDAFIFDQKRRKLLDWPMRFHIINGIARGLLYLHQDSRLRIIHRDLKASNVLLDYDMNPKISDFGMARSFGGNEIQGNTKRVVGTYGYMSPEYAIDGQFSIKSDVFSFGVLVLEIVSGKKNRGFYHPDHKHNLLGHAWRLYLEEKSLELMDESLKESCILSEVTRSIHVGLLCVQQSPEDRPNMSTVVLMLSSDIALPQPKEPGFFTERKVLEQESSSSKSAEDRPNMSTVILMLSSDIALPQPKEPDFFTERRVLEQESSSGKVDTCSANEITITLLAAR